MSLQFILGNSGSGKSHRLYQYIVEESMKNPRKNYLILVPEQFTMQTQKDLCMVHPRHGIMNIDVLSFVRLAHRVFGETGKDTRKILDDEGKNLILRKIAGKCQNELSVLRGNLRRQGYISKVKSILSEFTQYGIGFKELDDLLGSLDDKGSLYYKLKDIRRVYQEFEDYLAEKYITKEELLDLLSTAVPYSQILKGSVVALDGFTGFTPVQNRLLGELMRVCEKVIVTVEMDEREDTFSYRSPYELFAVSKQMTTSLMKTAREKKIYIEDPIFLYKKPLPRFMKNPALAFLESSLFRYGTRTYEKEQESVFVHGAAGMKEEAEFVAAQIRCLAREKGYRFRDMAVIVSDMNLYAAHLEKAFASYGIPVFMDNKKSILLNTFIEYLRSLLDMAVQGFRYESVFRFLRTGMTGFEREEIDFMENYILAIGLKGYKKWQGPWVRRTAEINQEELAELNALRVRFVEKLDALMLLLRKPKKTVRDITQAVYEFLAQEQMQEKLQKMEQKFQEDGNLALAREYAQIYRIVIELFDRFVELLGEEQVSLREYCEILDAGLEEAKVGVIPPSLDQVVVGDMERTRLNHLKVLFFVGAGDGCLPGNMAQEGLLSERDREAFSRQKLSLSPGAKEKIYIQKFYLYLNLTRPSDRLYLSYSKVSVRDGSQRPSYLLQEIFRLYPGIKVYHEEQRPLLEQELTKQKIEKIIASGLQDRWLGLSEQWKELYTWYRGEERQRAERILEAAFYKKDVQNLTKESAAALFGDVTRAGVSRLKEFASCAYSHFLDYGLGLSEREQYRFEAIDLGNIVHRSMECFSQKAKKHKLDWTEIPDGLRAEFIEESVEESIVDYGNTVLYSTARNEYMITWIKKLISRSVWALTRQLEQGDFRPAAFEMKFGSGKIDRIDTCEDENQVYVRVTDYKTGEEAFDITAFYHGLQLQLPVYLNAALEMEKKKNPGKEIIPAGIYYYRIFDPIVEKEKDDQILEENLLKKMKAGGLTNSAENVICHTQRNLEKNSNFFQLSRNNNGELSKASKVLSSEEFSVLLEYAMYKEAELKEKIKEGEAQIFPYEMKEHTGCDYCNYKSICGFDSRLEGNEYRVLEKYSMEDTMDQMRNILGRGGKETGGKKEEA